MNKRTALIIIDSGFSSAALELVADRVLGICDLSLGSRVEGDPFVGRDALEAFAGDPLNHGSVVLENVARLVSLPVVLVRAWGPAGMLRTKWGGQQGGTDAPIVQPGWTEGYTWAVELCRKLGLKTVTNCSFGGFIHASDGTGWEAFHVSKLSGPDHLVVAAAGPGDGRALHATAMVLPEHSVTISGYQKDKARYNFWDGHSPTSSDSVEWRLDVYLNEQQVLRVNSKNVPLNMWNGRQQQTLELYGTGIFRLVITRLDRGTENGGDQAVRFDCWIETEGTYFFDHVNAESVCEPALFPEVLAVGLNVGMYSPNQFDDDAKPDCLLPGVGAISFRIPEITAALGALLERSDAPVDVSAAKKVLGKYPDYAKIIVGN